MAPKSYTPALSLSFPSPRSQASNLYSFSPLRRCVKGMTQSQIDMTTHLGFQLSLLKLSTIPGPNGQEASESVVQEARQLEAIVDRFVMPVRA